MSAASTRIILYVDKSKEKAFLEMLKLFDFVQVLSKEEILHNFIKNAPKKVPLSEEDVLAEVLAHRYGEKK